MQTFTGIPVSRGTAIGTIRFIHTASFDVQENRSYEPAREEQRFFAARDALIHQFQEYAEVLLKSDREAAMIFRSYVMVLADEEFETGICSRIRQQEKTVEVALKELGQEYFSLYAAAEADTARKRTADLQDLLRSMQEVLAGGNALLPLLSPSILAASELSPADLMQLDPGKILGIILEAGAPGSHLSILARSLQIPLIIGIPLPKTSHMHAAVLDGNAGCLFLDPDEETLKEYRSSLAAEKTAEKALTAYIEKRAVLLSGKKLPVLANISQLAELKAAKAQGAEGIGLFRSEFLFLEEKTLPDEEMQFQYYRRLLTKMEGMEVTIRTADLGADKSSPALPHRKEPNPALGLRGIRLSLSCPELFRTQLRALLRASCYGRLAILYPMITSLSEIREIRMHLYEIMEELKSGGIPLGDFRQGIMIETPAAVELSDLLAKEVDFFSIGTNDLCQYTLALDRSNPSLAGYFEPHHEAILRQIKRTTENAHAAQIPVRICGELGADISLTKELLELGIDAFSVATGDVPAVRKAILDSGL